MFAGDGDGRSTGADAVEPTAAAAADDGWYAQLAAALPGAWFRFSADGRYLGAGGSLDGVLFRSGEVVGRTLDDIVPGERASRVREGIADALRSGRGMRMFSVARGDESWCFEVVFSAISPREVVAFARDVTARVAAERRVSESEQRFRAVVEAANEGVWMLDADGRTSFATQRMADILGCTLEDLLARSPLDFMDETSREAFAERQRRRRHGEADAATAFSLRTLDGRDVDTTMAASPLYDADGRYVGAVAVVTDDTDRVEAERRLAESQRRLGAVAEVHDDVFYIGEIRPDGSYHELFSGPGTARLLGATAEPESDALGAVWDAAVHPDDRAAYAEMNRRIVAAEPAECEYRLVGVDGVVRWVHDRARPRGTQDGAVVFDGVVSDVTARRRQADALRAALADAEAADAALRDALAASEQLGRTDALTGIYNRRHFHAALAAELARGERHGDRAGVVLLDVDHFKRINDTYGHETGDQVLQAIATTLASALRPYDVLARWGGEEFVVLVANVPDEATLARIGKSLLEDVRKTTVRTSRGDTLAITMSAGAALQLRTGAAADVVIDAADAALYAAKRRGRDQLVLHRDLTPSDTAPEEPEAVRLAEGLAIAASIREAIPPLHCQQVADLAEITARQLGLADAMVLRCRLVGWLHDIGKLAIPDRILNKVGALEDDDRAVLRRHTEIGAAILQTLPSLRDAAAGVRHHHERYDGSGYPDRLARDGIPLEARIVAVCDAYSAITAGRPYQPALDHEQALAQLAYAAGKSLDPVILDALRRALDTRHAPPATTA